MQARGSGDGRGNARMRGPESSRMSTRQFRNSEEEEMIERNKMIDKALKDANIGLDISQEEKLSIYEAIQASNDVKQVEHETQRLSLNSGSPDSQRNPDSQHEDKFQKAPTSQCSQDIYEDVEEAQPIRSPLQESKQLTHLYTSSRDEDSSMKGTRPGLVGRGPSERGRGRATPKVKYNPLPIASPGQRNNMSQMRSPEPTVNVSSSECHSSGPPVGYCSLEDCPLSPQDIPPTDEEVSDTRQSTQNSIQSLLNEESISDQSSPHHVDSGPEVEKSESGEMSQEPLSPEDCRKKVGNRSLKDDESEAVDVESDCLAEDCKENNTSICGEKPDSPASVEDAVNEDEKESLEVKMVGNMKCTVSPLQHMSRSFPNCTSLPFFKELEKFRGNKVDYMEHARKLSQACRYAVLDKIFVENSIWGPPIPDGGYNKQTLFKQSLPKYSKLLGNSSDKQGLKGGATIRTSERAAKSQAYTKMQGIANEMNRTESDFYSSRQRSKQKDEEWTEPEFHSLRQKPRQVKSHDPSEGKRIHQGNAWGPKKGTDACGKDEVECLDASAPVGDGEHWQTERVQKKRPGDSDSETSPEPPAASGPDVYDFDDEGERDSQEIFGPKQLKNKRNNKRGGPWQGDVDVDAKSLPRPRGGQNQRGRNTKLRLQKGAIAHPSEHATSANAKQYFKNRGGASGQSDGDIISQNNDNTGNKWISMDSKDTRNSNISSTQFYGSNSKVIQPRTPLTAQPRNAPRETQTHSAFPLSPNAPGSHFGLDHDRNDAAAAGNTECPICNKMFPAKEIMAHSSDCFAFSSDAVGEKSADDMKDSVNSDNTVSEDIEDPGSPSASGKEATLSIQCKKCKVHLKPESMRLHLEECDDVRSQTGLKRASSTEEGHGPAKKTSRRMD